MRSGINTYLTRTPCNRTINMKVDRDFAPSNNMPKAMASKYLKSNESSNDNVYKALSDTDLHKLRSYFTRDTPSPTKLQHEAFLTLAYCKGYKGREWARNIEKGHLKFKAEEEQVEYADLEISII